MATQHANSRRYPHDKYRHMTPIEKATKHSLEQARAWLFHRHISVLDAPADSVASDWRTITDYAGKPRDLRASGIGCMEA